MVAATGRGGGESILAADDGRCCCKGHGGWPCVGWLLGGAAGRCGLVDVR